MGFNAPQIEREQIIENSPIELAYLIISQEVGRVIEDFSIKGLQAQIFLVKRKDVNDLEKAIFNISNDPLYMLKAMDSALNLTGGGEDENFSNQTSEHAELIKELKEHVLEKKRNFGNYDTLIIYFQSDNLKPLVFNDSDSYLIEEMHKTIMLLLTSLSEEIRELHDVVAVVTKKLDLNVLHNSLNLPWFDLMEVILYYKGKVSEA